MGNQNSIHSLTKKKEKDAKATRSTRPIGARVGCARPKAAGAPASRRAGGDVRAATCALPPRANPSRPKFDFARVRARRQSRCTLGRALASHSRLSPSCSHRTCITRCPGAHGVTRPCAPPRPPFVETRRARPTRRPARRPPGWSRCRRATTAPTRSPPGSSSGHPAGRGRRGRRASRRRGTR